MLKVYRSMASLAALLALTSCVGTGTGLHNSSKIFTPPSEMKRSDWSDAAEMERTWLAARVRIPKPGEAYIRVTMEELLDGCRSIGSSTDRGRLDLSCRMARIQRPKRTRN